MHISETSPETQRKP